MPVLLFNGSSHTSGCTFTALREVEGELKKEGIETEILQIGAGPVLDCIGCDRCSGRGTCVFTVDVVNDCLAKSKQADGYVFGTPVYSYINHELRLHQHAGVEQKRVSLSCREESQTGFFAL